MHIEISTLNFTRYINIRKIWNPYYCYGRELNGVLVERFIFRVGVFADRGMLPGLANQAYKWPHLIMRAFHTLSEFQTLVNTNKSIFNRTITIKESKGNNTI